MQIWTFTYTYIYAYACICICLFMPISICRCVRVALDGCVRAMPTPNLIIILQLGNCLII